MNPLELFIPKVPLLSPPNLQVVNGVITENDFHVIKALKAAGYGKRKIGGFLNLDPETVRSYLNKEVWEPYHRDSSVRNSLDPLNEWLKNRAPEVGFNGKVLFREAVQKGFSGSYETVKRFVRPLRQEHRSTLTATIRFETSPGKQGQVDWGSSKVWLGDQFVRVHFFALVLGFSRRMFARGYHGEKRHYLIDGHQRAFAWFQGYPQELLYDNARTMVMTDEPGEGRLNKVFKDFAEHYGFEPRFCRPYRPQTKGKIESGIKYLKRNFLAGRRFRDLDDLNQELEKWLVEVADTRIHGTTFVQPIQRFPQEQSNLIPLARARPWNPDLRDTRIVANDGRVSYETNRYPVPLTLANQEVWLQIEEPEVVILHQGKAIARHRLINGHHQEAPCPSEFTKLPPTAVSPLAQKPKHEPRWAFEEVQVRSLDVYDQISNQSEVAA